MELKLSFGLNYFGKLRKLHDLYSYKNTFPKQKYLKK